DDSPPYAFLEPAAVRPDGELRERSFFVPLAGDGKTRRVSVDAATAPVALVAARGGGPPGLVRILVDGQPASVLPVLAPLERIELLLAPGAHQVAVDARAFAGTVLLDAASLDEPGPGAPLR